jgi:hypothetical protein
MRRILESLNAAVLPAALLLTLALLVPSFSPAAAHVDLGVVVGTPPPPPPAAVVPGPVGVAPGPGYVWVDGYWNWVNGGWVWVPGRWVLPPHGHGVWVAPRIEFRWHGGRWR